MHYERVEHNGKALVYTIILHGVLLLLVWNIKVFFEVEPPPFYELSLGSVSQQRLQQIIEESQRMEEARRLREQA